MIVIGHYSIDNLRSIVGVFKKVDVKATAFFKLDTEGQTKKFKLPDVQKFNLGSPFV